MERTYTVEGTWPFPLDMLRRDQARAATPADQVLIDRMSGETSDAGFGTGAKVAITLIMESGEPTVMRPNGRFLPHATRWESFGWTVVGDPDIDFERSMKAQERDEEALRRSGLAKLTDAERRALRL